MVDELALLFTAGRMSKESRDIVKLTYEQTTGASKKLRMAIKLMLMSPDFHTTGLFKPINEARPEPKQPDPPTNPYKALVYVNLDGGLDSFNTLVPYSNCNNGKGNVFLLNSHLFVFCVCVWIRHSLLIHLVNLIRHV